MENRIRLGIIGASAVRGWANQAHLPGLPYLDEYELRAVCTSKPDTAARAAKEFGAPLAFHDYRELVSHPEVDAVVICVRAPAHREPTLAALEAHKPVFTEWPLGVSLAETEEIANVAAKVGVAAMVGLQGRVGPANMYVKYLVQSGYVGKVLSCVIYRVTTGQEKTSEHAWDLDKSNGATSLTIAAGHTLDTLAFVLGEFSELSAWVRTQHSPLRLTDTGEEVSVTSPDHVLVQGVLENGALASVYVASVPGYVTGGRLEIYGTEGTILVTSPESLHRGVVTVRGSQNGRAPEELTVPDHYRWVPAGVPEAAPLNVAQLYRLFSGAIREGKTGYPDFQDAATRYRLLDAVTRASELGVRITL